MGRPRAEVTPEQQPLVEAAVRAREAARAAEVAYRAAVAEAVDSGVNPAALARDLGVASTTVYGMVKAARRHADP